jgi:outer membrane protein assembly factor BamB
MLKRVSYLYRRAAAASGVAALASVLALCFVSAASAATAGWPMFQGNPQHSGQATVAGPTSPTIAWTFGPNDGYHPEAVPPIVGSDGTVYVARVKQAENALEPCPESSVVDALAPKGRLLWQWPDPCRSIFLGGMAVATDGTVFAIDGSSLVAIAPGGTTRWRTPLSSEGEVTIGPHGILYVQDESSKVYAVKPTNGQVLWTYSPPRGFSGSDTPTVSPDGSTIYAGSGSGVLTALTTSGAVKWTLNVGSPIANAPAVGPDGTIYVATGGDLDAVTPQGTVKWTFAPEAGIGVGLTPAVGNDGLIFAAATEGRLIAVRAVDGSLGWIFQSPGATPTSSPLIDANGTPYVEGQADLFALGEGREFEGIAVWTLPTGGSIGSPLALDPATGHLYFVSHSGLVSLSATHH